MALAHVEWQYRRLLRSLQPYQQSKPINFSVELRVRDAPELGPYRFGGMFDPLTCQWVGEAKEPAAIWEVGRGQLYPFQFIQRKEGERLVIVGAKGAGKTEVLPRLAIFYGMGLINADIGMLAPTHPRLSIMRNKFMRLLHPSWIADISAEEGYIMLANRVKYEFLSLKMQSLAMGPPSQGRDWCAGFMDEEQNAHEMSVADVEARGRAAPELDTGKSYYPVVSTCTISDLPEFRERLARYRAEPDISVFRMEATANPFVPADHWERLRRRMTPRQYAQEVLALEQAPVRATYPAFERGKHIRPFLLGAQDITERVTGGRALVGFDPGEMCHVSIYLKCYQPQKGRRIWFVVDELTTDRTTVEAHGVEMVRRLEALGSEAVGGWYPDDCRADPHGNTETRPDVTVYRQLQLMGIKVRPAVYRNSPNPAIAARPGTLKKNARIECVNRLLQDASGVTRLYILCDEDGRPVAPRLATALEMSQRDEYGRAEMDKKDEHDLSHWPAALGYALWPYERVKIEQVAVGGMSYG